MLGKYLSHKVEYITSSLYNRILLWKGKLPFPLKNNPKRRRIANTKVGLQVGLKTLIPSQEKQKPPPRILHCNKMAPPTENSKLSSPPRRLPLLWSWPSPASRCSMMGDVIGTESGDCMSSDIMEVRSEGGEIRKMKGRERNEKKKKKKKKREFPPLLTLLRETGGITMPWSFKREKSDEGRLMITAERVKRGEYMESRRKDGRIMMRLVEEDDDYCEECGYPMNELEDLEELERVDDDDDGGGYEFEEGSLENGRCGDLRKCVTYGGGGLLQDSESFWNGTGIGDANVYLGRPGSAPLRPMTPVM